MNPPYNIEEHREGLINVYGSFLYGATSFEHALFNKAIQKLEDDLNPKDVEQWVIDMQNLWSKLL